MELFSGLAVTGVVFALVSVMLAALERMERTIDDGVETVQPVRTVPTPPSG